MTDRPQEGKERAVHASDPEVPEKPVRRLFHAAYKRRILEEADRLSQPGELGQLLRREGLYSSHLSSWRKQRDAGALAALQAQRRGPKPAPVNPLVKENERLRRNLCRVEERLEKAETIIDVQKKSRRCWGCRARRTRTDGGRRAPRQDRRGQGVL